MHIFLSFDTCGYTAPNHTFANAIESVFTLKLQFPKPLNEYQSKLLLIFAQYCEIIIYLLHVIIHMELRVKFINFLLLSEHIMDKSENILDIKNLEFEM